jgi:hypothetical protein
VEAMGKPLDTITSWEVRGFFEHWGYRLLDQQFDQCCNRHHILSCPLTLMTNGATSYDHGYDG